jgi:hypothetical protein
MVVTLVLSFEPTSKESALTTFIVALPTLALVYPFYMKFAGTLNANATKVFAAVSFVLVLAPSFITDASGALWRVIC